MCGVPCSELPRIEGNESQGLCPDRAYVLVQGYKSNAHEVTDPRRVVVGREHTYYLVLLFH